VDLTVLLVLLVFLVIGFYVSGSKIWYIELLLFGYGFWIMPGLFWVLFQRNPLWRLFWIITVLPLPLWTHYHDKRVRLSALNTIKEER